jgi:glycosyltransferase involved in cell wall biosynthesis
VTDAIVPQRLVLVLPSTAEHDSRTYRIASSVAARGHEVTVIARQGPGLAADESHPAGYRILRVPVSAVAGLPLPRSVVGRIERPRSRGRGGPDAGPGPGASAHAPAPEGPVAGPGRVRRAIGSARRMAAIGLTVRAQQRASRAVDPGADLYHGMAYMGIPVALDLARPRGSAVVYDARDIYVDAGNLARLPGGLRRLLGRLERGWARRAHRVVTVNQPYADVMAERWEVEPPRVVLNCAYRTDPPDSPVRRFHERLGLAPGTAVVLYHGGFSPGRGIEQLLEAIPRVPDAVLVLMGYGVMADDLERRVRTPELAGRAFVLPAVPPTDLLDWVAAADVAAMPIQPTTLNHRLTTPNKLLEAIAVGVPVVASDLPGMAAIAVEAGGELCDPEDPASIAGAIRRILEEEPSERAARRARVLRVAHERYTWEAQLTGLLAEYGRLTGRPW